MVNEKILLAKEALIEQTDKPVTIDSTWMDLNLDSLDMFDVVLYIEDRIGREIDNKVVEIKLLIPGNDLFVERQSKTFEEGIDDCIEVLKRQITKHKEKQRIN